MSSSNRGVIAVVLVVVIAIAGLGIYFIAFNPFAPTDTTTTTTTTTTTPTTGNPNPFTAAIVFGTGGLGDKSFNDGCYKGALDAAAEFGIEFTFVEPAAIAEFEGFLRTYAAHAQFDDPYDIIIGVGFEIADAMMAVADDYPNQKFAIIDMFIDPTNYTNIASLLFQEEQGSALVGAMAGLLTQQNKIGFVGGKDWPLIHKFLAGYVFGANLTNPSIANADFLYSWADTWEDPTIGYTQAAAHYAAGADIVYAAAGRTGLGVIDASKFENASYVYPIWSIGVDSPQMYLGTLFPDSPAPRSSVITSMLKRVDTAVHDVIEQVVTGTFVGGPQTFNLTNGGVGYEPPSGLSPADLSPYSPALQTIPQSVIDIVEDVKAAILNGSLVIPTTIYWTP